MPRKNGRHFTDDIFKWIFLTEHVWISINISLKFVPVVQINNIQALVQIMAWRRPGDKPLSVPMMLSLLTHIRVNRHQWVNNYEKAGFTCSVENQIKTLYSMADHEYVCKWTKNMKKSKMAVNFTLYLDNCVITFVLDVIRRWFWCLNRSFHVCKMSGM